MAFIYASRLTLRGAVSDTVTIWWLQSLGTDCQYANVKFKFGVNEVCLRKLNDVEVKGEYHIKISDKLPLDNCVVINRPMRDQIITN
jgi:hypothetical protein